MDLGISGKTALVLGASSGLGKAIAIGLAKEGVNVAIAARRADELANTAALLEAEGVKVLPIQWDLKDLSVIPGNIAAIEKALGPVEILINNGGGPPPTPAAAQDPELWQSSFQAMIVPLIAITDAVLPGMRQRGWGRIITSTSSTIQVPLPNMAMSNSLRAVLHGWSKTLSKEIAKDGVTTNILVPGRIATDRIAFLDNAQAQRQNRDAEEVKAENLAAIPMGRLGDPAEYAAMAVFLAGKPASYITGSVVRVDGGQMPTTS